MTLSIAVRLAAVCLLLMAGARAFAAEPLTLTDAIRRALDQQPELRGFEYRLRAEDARVGESGLAPAISVGLLVEDAAGSGARRGLDSAQTTLSLSRVIELGGKRSARTAVAEAGRDRVRTELAARQLDVTAEVARRFVETLHGRELVNLAGEVLRQSEVTRDAVDQRVRAALAPAAERARAEVRVAQSKLDLEHAEHELQTARVFLAAAMGERNVRFTETLGDLYAMPDPAPLDDLLARIESTPDFAVFADEARLRDAEMRLALLQRKPDLRAEIGVRRYEDVGDTAFVAGISVPLQSGRRARFGVDAAAAERDRSDANREAAFLKVRSRLFAQYRELEHSLLEARTLRDTILPQLEDALKRTEHAFRRGRYSYLELTDAQRELLAARQRVADVAANYHTMRIEIERLTGEGLEATGDSP
jgi:cobalt-zinc-cadmium efflux system outer membrane protein